ncbi:hypothetical protein CBR_g61456 [Chara braunii]|uniref:Uncharacterized protein n=1 Tax=Chara braunii TaxID=69332 RepID=A0A388K8Q7_CHABU|nr:hypothetical protein CBR_g61456 [Chara braunii]|eukprot:GBG66411.1 hypothetical protein CBR_g61456 [Chara braunii]
MILIMMMAMTMMMLINDTDDDADADADDDNYVDDDNDDDDDDDAPKMMHNDNDDDDSVSNAFAATAAAADDDDDDEDDDDDDDAPMKSAAAAAAADVNNTAAVVNNAADINTAAAVVNNAADVNNTDEDDDDDDDDAPMKMSITLLLLLMMMVMMMTQVCRTHSAGTNKARSLHTDDDDDKDLNMTILDEFSDSLGRWSWASVCIEDIEWTFASIYAPVDRREKIQFFGTLPKVSVLDSKKTSSNLVERAVISKIGKVAAVKDMVPRSYEEFGTQSLWQDQIGGYKVGNHPLVNSKRERTVSQHDDVEHVAGFSGLSCAAVMTSTVARPQGDSDLTVAVQATANFQVQEADTCRRADGMDEPSGVAHQATARERVTEANLFSEGNDHQCCDADDDSALSSVEDDTDDDNRVDRDDNHRGCGVYGVGDEDGDGGGGGDEDGIREGNGYGVDEDAIHDEDGGYVGFEDGIHEDGGACGGDEGTLGSADPKDFNALKESVDGGEAVMEKSKSAFKYAALLGETVRAPCSKTGTQKASLLSEEQGKRAEQSEIVKTVDGEQEKAQRLREIKDGHVCGSRLLADKCAVGRSEQGHPKAETRADNWTRNSQTYPKERNIDRQAGARVYQERTNGQNEQRYGKSEKQHMEADCGVSKKGCPLTENRLNRTTTELQLKWSQPCAVSKEDGPKHISSRYTELMPDMSAGQRERGDSGRKATTEEAIHTLHPATITPMPILPLRGQSEREATTEEEIHTLHRATTADIPVLPKRRESERKTTTEEATHTLRQPTTADTPVLPRRGESGRKATTEEETHTRRLVTATRIPVLPTEPQPKSQRLSTQCPDPPLLSRLSLMTLVANINDNWEQATAVGPRKRVSRNATEIYLSSRRRVYQEIVKLEEEGLQLVERTMGGPVDLILTCSSCLVVYTAERLHLDSTMFLQTLDQPAGSPSHPPPAGGPSASTAARAKVSSCCKNIIDHHIAPVSSAFEKCAMAELSKVQQAYQIG